MSEESYELTGQEGIEILLVFSDMAYLRRIFEGTIRRPKEDTSIVGLCSLHFICFLVHEVWKRLHAIPNIPRPLTDIVTKASIEESRNTVKLFDRRDLSFAGITTLMETEVIERQRNYFRRNHLLRLLRAKDLGIYRYRGKLIGTTHGIRYNLGLPFEVSIDEAGPEILEVSRQCSAFVNGICSAFSWQGPSYLDEIALEDITHEDVRSEDYYSQCWGEDIPLGLGASLSSFHSSLNFLQDVLSADRWLASRPNIVKLKYITIRHAFSSLRLVENQIAKGLQPHSRSHLREMLAVPTDRALLLPTRRGDHTLRNALTHYDLSQIDLNRLDGDRQLFGLIEAVHPEHTFSTFSALIESEIARMRAVLASWSSGSD